MPSYTYRCADCEKRMELLQSIAEMQASRQAGMRCVRCEGHMEFVFPAPAVVTDTSFMANRSDLGFGNDEFTRRRKVAQAKRNGTDIGSKTFSPQLGDWVGSRAEVAEKAAARGWNVEESTFDTHLPEKPPEPPKPYQVDEKIVQRETDLHVEREKLDLTPKERTQLADQSRTRLRGTQDD